MGTGGSLGFTGQSACLLGEFQASERPFLKSNVNSPEVDLWPTHKQMYDIYVHVPTYTCVRRKIFLMVCSLQTSIVPLGLHLTHFRPTKPPSVALWSWHLLCSIVIPWQIPFKASIVPVRIYFVQADEFGRKDGAGGGMKEVATALTPLT